MIVANSIEQIVAKFVFPYRSREPETPFNSSTLEESGDKEMKASLTLRVHSSIRGHGF